METSAGNWCFNRVSPFQVGLVGLGGYAGSLCDILVSRFAAPDSVARLTAVCEPDRATHAARIEQLTNRGIRYFSASDELLASDVHGVCLPLPIDLHRPFTERACAAGKHVLCEKPSAGSVDDLDAMIAARDRAGVAVAIGFQHIYDPATIERKRAMLRGPRPDAATVLACWPRDAAYYSRNAWAGRLRRNNAWVLDSPANNALAHYINLALFLLGPDLPTSATPVAVAAELYRVNEIENYDTCALRISTDTASELLVFLTHACRETIDPQISFRAGGAPIAAEHGAGGATMDKPDLRVAMFRKFARWARGGDEIVATLEVSRSHLVVVNGASQCTPVHAIPANFRETLQRENSTVTTIAGIESVFRSCADQRRLPSELEVPWAQPAGELDVRNYSHFPGPATSTIQR
ncbi:Gfo/Idh/MocA family oxidoreductase [soil metagenome]